MREIKSDKLNDSLINSTKWNKRYALISTLSTIAIAVLTYMQYVKQAEPITGVLKIQENTKLHLQDTILVKNVSSEIYTDKSDSLKR
jgi:hypothetical protein